MNSVFVRAMCRAFGLSVVRGGIKEADTLYIMLCIEEKNKSNYCGTVVLLD